MTTVSPLSRLSPSAHLERMPLVAVLRARHADAYAPVVAALVDGGVCSIEITLSTPGALEAVPELRDIVGGRAEIGVGTVVSEAAADAALAAGADYLVTPVVDEQIITRCVDAGVPIYAGALSPTEVHTAWRAGATAVKIFPASTVGPSYAAHLRGPFPDLRIMPSGGVGIDDIVPWLDAGAIAVSIGGPLLKDALGGGSAADLTARTRRAVDLVEQWRSR
ncbi:bifunctional 4-hydroxy-2-oxoglutarate aldolase/2-dehydro-3-deoxy-phosphogluconate aldolase [Microbacterium sp. SSW1-59]|uniref:bifunctional 4-hydroxy-2-oxoglutarate aldolase/2-dehydro-3-deoxy-phosphogluconate aldolase n=1 Tax=Microbacterium xanthum TaxID=3079794 RepID=UPI002AD37466|nr:bifunctional 4-hydroxy-2-oxoglutarate aldolase/2-dehydro-3-deoxy-phosphogluconate aldolase [Microbacterium sp. SSW1-59]MDZ8200370.1 bifunctional 4-hydroxy-2-oxoglutarate aldolase/2-dehydro-3-deoxy-phosphogluconate aldolase [Microbacterium sp. SSW1-59]